jgi:hypothetical protein
MQADLDAKARASTEAKLAKIRAEHEQHKREELERKMAVRYHKVRPDSWLHCLGRYPPSRLPFLPLADRARVHYIPPHMQVKFFERVKAERQVKQLQAQLKQAVMDGEEELVAVCPFWPVLSTLPPRLPSF